ncbi:hypothetical protein Leryth_002954 [Lithospermum erythrorhizon]|nr:hypothetical protein Leryth_002954 [Lithospermum erythrorhizon]
MLIFKLIFSWKTLELKETNSCSEHFEGSLSISQVSLIRFSGINRGIFGMPSAKKTEIEELVKLLESKNPTIEPTEQLEKLAGTWKLVYSTITILGSKRTKLGLRDFISLGDFLQIINIAEEKAVNVIKFSARGFDMLSGQLQIDASFKIASKSVKGSTLELR